MGTLVLAGTGGAGGAVLAAFFVSSSLVSRLAPSPPAGSGPDPKGERRDPRQVLANGGVAAVLALAGRHDPLLGVWLLTATLAAAAADTWATAVGGRSRAAPRSLRDWRPVPTGTSGGITLAGSLGGAVGGALVAATGAVVSGSPALLPLGTLVGFLGMAADSLLGATLQGRFRCPTCGAPSEWPVHRCGTRTTHEGGIRWLDNDGVNLLGTLAAAMLGGAAWLWCCRS